MVIGLMQEVVHGYQAKLASQGHITKTRHPGGRGGGKRGGKVRFLPLRKFMSRQTVPLPNLSESAKRSRQLPCIALTISCALKVCETQARSLGVHDERSGHQTLI